MNDVVETIYWVILVTDLYNKLERDEAVKNLVTHLCKSYTW